MDFSDDETAGFTTRLYGRRQKLGAGGANGPAFRQARSRGVERKGILKGQEKWSVEGPSKGVETFLGRAMIRGSLCLLPDMTPTLGKRLLKLGNSHETFSTTPNP